MFGSLISGLFNSRYESQLARMSLKQAEREYRMDAMRREQDDAHNFMRRNGCKMVIIRPDGTMVVGD